MSECNDVVSNMAIKLQDKNEKKDFKLKISRMKKKLDKYFIFISKNDNIIIENEFLFRYI